MTKSVLIITCSLFLAPELAGGVLPGQADARSSGLANISTILPGTGNLLCNPGSLAGTGYLVAGISHHRYLDIKSLANSAIEVILPLGRSAIALSYRNQGFSALQSHCFSASAGLHLHEKISAGLRVGYVLVNAPAIREKGHSVTYELGLVVEIGPRLAAGISCSDPFPARGFHDDFLVTMTTLKAGVRYEAAKSLFLLAEYCRDDLFPGSIRLAGEINLKDRLALRTGAQARPLLLSFGAGIRINRMTIDLSFSFYDRMGTIPGSSVRYSLK